MESHVSEVWDAFENDPEASSPTIDAAHEAKIYEPDEMFQGKWGMIFDLFSSPFNVSAESVYINTLTAHKAINSDWIWRGPGH